jgi:hypothetical protein
MDCGLILCRGEHRDAPAPRMPEHVPSFDAKGFAYRRRVTRIVLDPRAPGTRRLLRPPSSTLVEEKELATLGKRCKRRPQYVVAEVKPAINAEKRKLAADCRTRIDREVETASANGPMSQRRSLLLLSAECKKSFTG